MAELTTTLSRTAPDMVNKGTELPLLAAVRRAKGKIGLMRSRNMDRSIEAGPLLRFAHGCRSLAVKSTLFQTDNIMTSTAT